MAAVPVEIRGTLYDLASKSSRQVFLVGEASRSDLTIGGGPVYPPDKPPGGNGDHIWGPPDYRPGPPIYLPPQVPPDMKPPEVPPPGTATAVPGQWPHSNMVPPEYIVVQYPGIGPVVVTAPPHAEPAG